jgi:hypothetical protein
MKYAEPGSVSHGTLLEEDLIPAFMDELEYLDPEAYAEAKAELELFSGEDEVGLSLFLNDYLFDLLDEYSPPGHYFGAHPGDGSDFGWWPVEEEW